MNGSQKFKLLRLIVILGFILVIVVMVITSEKQFVITKTVEVPVEVEKIVEVPVYIEQEESSQQDTIQDSEVSEEQEIEKNEVKLFLVLRYTIEFLFFSYVIFILMSERGIFDKLFLDNGLDKDSVEILVSIVIIFVLMVFLIFLILLM